MNIDELINALTNICQLVDGWTAGGCSCGAPVPWSPWDEETRQRCHKLLAAAYSHKDGRSELVVEKFTASNSTKPVICQHAKMVCRNDDEECVGTKDSCCEWK